MRIHATRPRTTPPTRPHRGPRAWLLRPATSFGVAVELAHRQRRNRIFAPGTGPSRASVPAHLHWHCGAVYDRNSYVPIGRSSLLVHRGPSLHSTRDYHLDIRSAREFGREMGRYRRCQARSKIRSLESIMPPPPGRPPVTIPTGGALGADGASCASLSAVALTALSGASGGR